MESRHWWPGRPALAQVKFLFPQNGLIMVRNLEEILISHCPLLLPEGAEEEVDGREPEDQGKQPPLPEEEERAPHPGGQVHGVCSNAGRGGQAVERDRPGPRQHGPYMASSPIHCSG